MGRTQIVATYIIRRQEHPAPVKYIGMGVGHYCTRNKSNNWQSMIILSIIWTCLPRRGLSSMFKRLTEWPDLAICDHFGKILNVYFVFGKVLQLIWQQKWSIWADLNLCKNVSGLTEFFISNSQIFSQGLSPSEWEDPNCQLPKKKRNDIWRRQIFAIIIEGKMEETP